MTETNPEGRTMWTPDLLTISEAAERLRVTPRTIRRWLASELLEVVTLPSGRKRIRSVWLDDLTSGDAA